MELRNVDRFKQVMIVSATFLFFGVMFGCAKPTIYRWNAYESITHDMYINPGNADTDTQIVKLTEEIEKTHAEGKKVAPGLHAHLGYMYFLKGNSEFALREFNTEKQLFPESKKFIDGILERMNRK